MTTKAVEMCSTVIRNLVFYQLHTECNIYRRCWAMHRSVIAVTHFFCPASCASAHFRMGHNTHSSILYHKVLLMLGRFMAAQMTDGDVDNCSIQRLYHHRHHHQHHQQQQWLVSVSDVYCSPHFLNCRWSASCNNRWWVTRTKVSCVYAGVRSRTLTRCCQPGRVMSFTLYSEMLVLIAAVQQTVM